MSDMAMCAIISFNKVKIIYNQGLFMCPSYKRLKNRFAVEPMSCTPKE